ncbi:MAG: carboxypeptidase-like regulatory domain-containing protein, partial [Chitinispirillia bacterium]
MNRYYRKKLKKYCLVINSIFCLILFTHEAHSNITTAKIEGVATDMQDAPVSNADITLYKYGTTEVFGGCRTDFYGHFNIDNILIDTNGYYLQIDHEEGAVYPKQYWHQIQNTSQIPNKPILLRSGNIFSVHIQLTSQPAVIDDTTFYDISSIMGRVVDESGQVLTGTRVYATTIDTINPDMVDSAITDSEGKFKLYRVPAFLPHFLAFAPSSNSGLPNQFWSQDTMTSFPQQEVTTESYNTLNIGEVTILQEPVQDTVNQNLARVKVILLDLSNRPVKNSCYLSLMKGTDVMSKSLESGFLDTFIVFNDVSEGNYSLYLDVDGYPQQYYNPQGNTINNVYEFNLAEGELKYIDVRLTQDPQNEGVPNFSGYLRNSAGEPISNAKILVLDSTYINNHHWINIYHHWTDFSAVTDNNGYYAIYDVTPGKYVLLAGSANENYRSVFYPNAPFFNDAVQLEIINSNTAVTADFTLIPGSEVIGYVKDEEGMGISNIFLYLYRSHNNDTTKKRIVNLHYEARSDINGKFKFLGIPEGKWYINAHDPSDIYLVYHHDWEEITTNGTNAAFAD